MDGSEQVPPAHWASHLVSNEEERRGLLTREQLLRLEPPSGYTWERRPGLRTSGKITATNIIPEGSTDLVEVDLRRLYEWAKANDLALISTNPHGAVRLREPRTGARVYVRRQYIVKANAPDRLRVRTVPFQTPCCGTKVSAGTLVCRACYASTTCAYCGVAGFTLYKLGADSGPVEYVCAECSSPCEKKCGNRIKKHGSDNGLCQTCDPKVYCQWCDKTVSQSKATLAVPESHRPDGRIRQHAAWMCEACYDYRKCPKCKKFNLNIEVVGKGEARMCQLCKDELDAKDLEKHLDFKADEIPISGSLLIPSTKERPFRTISIETEVNGDGGFIARTLYRYGIVPLPNVAGYHQYAPENDQVEHIAFMKHDGTVTGGEIITYLLNLDDPLHAEGLMEVLRYLNALNKTGKLTYDANCGGHIHIDAHNLDFSDAWRYATVYNYLENVIYRLGGGGTDHRTLSNKRAHRDGRDYSGAIIKGPWGTQSTFGKSLMGMDRLCGLNFVNFIAGRQNCTCGAFQVENSKGCTCNLGKQTIEWRVWNATGNPRILHGWIALMQALTAFAESDVRMTEKEEAQYPAFGWDTQRFNIATHEKPTKERLEWLHANLPLSAAERDSLVYAAKNSELHVLGDSYLESLLTIENHSTIMEKKGARNPNRRQRRIRIAAPEPGQGIPSEDAFAPSPRLASRRRPRGISQAEWTNTVAFTNDTAVPSPFTTGR